MPLQLTMPPATEPVTLQQAKTWLKVETDDEDALIASLIPAARARAEWHTGRAFITQVKAADLAIVAAALLRGGGHDMCPAEVLRLPCDLGALMRAVTQAFERAGLEQGGEAAARQSPFPGTAA